LRWWDAHIMGNPFYWFYAGLIITVLFVQAIVGDPLMRNSAILVFANKQDQVLITANPISLPLDKLLGSALFLCFTWPIWHWWTRSRVWIWNVYVCESLFWSRLSNSMNLNLEPIFLSMFDGLDVERSNGHSGGMWITWSLNLAQSKVAYTRYMCPKRWRPVWGSWLAGHYSQANASSWNLHICSLNCSMTFSLSSVSVLYTRLASFNLTSIGCYECITG
jgi:hypothetical protein